MSPAWLADHGSDPSLRVADCRWYLADPARGRREYEAGHLPGAIFLSLDDDLSAAAGSGRHPLPDPKVFAEAMGRLGIGDGSYVVAYDDQGGAIAARLWWMLTAIGHRKVVILDGGVRAWVEAGERLTTDLPVYESEVLTPRSWHGLVDRDEVARLPEGSVLVDVRAPERYRGEVEPVDPIPGHIPGAINLPYSDNLDDEGRFRDPPWLRARYLEARVDGDHAVVYCGSGVTACHAILAMEIAGLGRGTLYAGSWSDWSTAGMRVETGA